MSKIKNALLTLTFMTVSVSFSFAEGLEREATPFSAITLPGGETGVGNGGEAIEIQNKLYLLDFVESGIELNPKFDSNRRSNNSFNDRVLKALANIEDEQTLVAVANKLEDIFKLNPVTARSLLIAIESFSWAMLPRLLLPIPTEAGPIDFNGAPRYLLAVRKNRVIRIIRENWERLDSGSRPGLIFHEVIYSLLKPERKVCRWTSAPFKKDTLTYFLQVSAPARDIVGHLFSNQFNNSTSVAFENFVGSKLPNFPVDSTSAEKSTGPRFDIFFEATRTDEFKVNLFWSPKIFGKIGHHFEYAYSHWNSQSGGEFKLENSQDIDNWISSSLLSQEHARALQFGVGARSLSIGFEKYSYLHPSKTCLPENLEVLEYLDWSPTEFRIPMLGIEVESFENPLEDYSASALHKRISARLQAIQNRILEKFR